MAYTIDCVCSKMLNNGLKSWVFSFTFQAYTLPHTEGPRLTWILGLEKTGFCKICVGGTVGGPLLMRKSPTCLHKPKIALVGSAVVH